MPNDQDMTFGEHALEAMGYVLRPNDALLDDADARIGPEDFERLTSQGMSRTQIGAMEAELRRPLPHRDEILEDPNFQALSRQEKRDKLYGWQAEIMRRTPARLRSDPEWQEKFLRDSSQFEMDYIDPVSQKSMAWGEHLAHGGRAFASSIMTFQVSQEIGKLGELQEVQAKLQAEEPGPIRDSRLAWLDQRIKYFEWHSEAVAESALKLKDKMAEGEVNRAMKLFQDSGGDLTTFALRANKRSDWIGLVVGMGLESVPSMALTMAGAIAGGVAGSEGGPPGMALGAATGTGAAAFAAEFSPRFGEPFFAELDKRHPGWEKEENRGELFTSLFEDREFISKITRQAASGAGAVGITEAAVSLLSFTMASRIMAGTRGASWGAKLRAGGYAFAGTQVIGMAGGSTGEFAAYLAEGKDPFTDKGLFDVTMEGLLEGVMGGPVEVVMAGVNAGRGNIQERKTKRRINAAISAKKAQAVSGWTEDTLTENGVPAEEAQKVMSEPDMAKRFDLANEALDAADERALEENAPTITEDGDGYRVDFVDGTSEQVQDLEEAEDAAKRWEGEFQQSRSEQIRGSRQVAEETRALGEHLQNILEGRGVEADVNFLDTFTDLTQRVESRVEAGMDREQATAEAVAEMREQVVQELEARGVPLAEAQEAAQEFDAATLAEAKVFGRNTVEIEGNMTRALVEMSLGATPVEVGHEAAEVYIKEAVANGAYTVDEILGWVNQWRAYNDQAGHDAENMSAEAKERVAREGFAELYEAYLAGEFRKMSLPESVVRFFENLAKFMSEVFRRAIGLQQAFKDGALDPKLKKALAEVMGTTPVTVEQIVEAAQEARPAKKPAQKQSFQDRLDQLTEAFRETLGAMPEEDATEEIEFAAKSLRKIAKSDVEISEAVEAVKNHSKVGTDGPLIALGLKKAPTHRKVWMPDVSVRRELIDPATTEAIKEEVREEVIEPYMEDGEVPYGNIAAGFKVDQPLSVLEVDQSDRILEMTEEEIGEYLRNTDVSTAVLLDVLRTDSTSTVIEDELTHRIRQQEVDVANAEQEAARGISLDDAIKAIGGLLTPRVARSNGEPLAGEFETAQKESGRKVIGRFKDKGKPYDKAVTELNDMGFNFDGPAALANAILENDRGETVYSTPPIGESYSLGINWEGRVPQAILKQRVESKRAELSRRQVREAMDFQALIEEVEESVGDTLAALSARLERLQVEMARRSYEAIRTKDGAAAVARDVRELEMLIEILPKALRRKMGKPSILAGRAKVETRRGWLHDRLQAVQEALPQHEESMKAKSAKEAVKAAKEKLAARESRKSLIRDVQEFEAIAELLPAEIRSQLGGSASLAKISTPESRQAYLARKLNRASLLLERHLKKLGIAEVHNILDAARDKIGDNRKGKGRSGGRGHVLQDLAESAVDMTPEEVARKLDALEAEMSTAEGLDLANLAEEWAVVNTMGALAERSSEDVGEAVSFLAGLVKDYKTRRRMLEEARNEALKEDRAELLGTQAKPFPTEAELSAGERKKKGLKGAKAKAEEHLNNILDLHQLLETVFPGSKVAQRLGQRLKDAENQAADRGIAHEENFFKQVRVVYGVDTKRQMNNALADLLDPVKESGFFMYSQAGGNFSIPVTHAQRVVNGFETYGLSAQQIEAVKEVYAEHQSQMEEAGKEIRTRKIAIEVAKAIYEGQENAEYSEVERASIADAYHRHLKAIELAEAQGKKKALAGFRKRKTVDAQLLATSKPTQKLAALKKKAELKMWVPSDTEQQEVSQFEALTYLALLEQPEYADKAQKMGFPPEAEEQLREFLSDEAIQLLDYMRETLAGMWPRLNAVYEGQNGVNLAKKVNYFMGIFDNVRDSEKSLDPFSPEHQMRGLAADFTRNRVPHAARPKRVSAFHSFFAHLEEAEYYIAFADVARDARALLSHKNVQRAVKANHGAAVNRQLQQTLQIIEGGGRIASEIRIADDQGMSRILRGLSATALAFNPKTLLINVTNVLAAYQEMSTKEFFGSAAKMGANWPLLQKRWKAIYDSPTIQRRLALGASPELKALLGADPKKTNVLTNLPNQGFALINWTDAVFLSYSLAVAYNAKFDAIVAANPDLTLEQAEAAAMAQTEEIAGKVQQPVNYTQKSLWENTASLWKRAFFGLFISDSRRKISNIVMEGNRLAAGKGEGSWAKLGKLGTLGFIVWPTMLWIVRGMVDMVFRGEEPEEAFQGKDFWANVLTGDSRGIPFAGQVYEMAVRSALGQKNWSTNIAHDFIGSLFPHNWETGEIVKDIQAGDYGEAVSDLGDSLKKVGLVYAPLGALGNLIFYGAGAMRNATDGEMMEDFANTAPAIGSALNFLQTDDAIVRAAEGERGKANVERQSEWIRLERLLKETKRKKDKESFLRTLDREDRKKIQDRLLKEELTRGDRALLSSSVGVENGARARAIVRALKSIPAEDRAAQLQHWVEVKVITKTVRRQLRELGVEIPR